MSSGYVVWPVRVKLSRCSLVLSASSICSLSPSGHAAGISGHSADLGGRNLLQTAFSPVSQVESQTRLDSAEGSATSYLVLASPPSDTPTEATTNLAPHPPSILQSHTNSPKVQRDEEGAARKGWLPLLSLFSFAELRYYAAQLRPGRLMATKLPRTHGKVCGLKPFRLTPIYFLLGFIPHVFCFLKVKDENF